jgi:hypothetical protein
VDESEILPVAFFEVAGGNIYAVDGVGTRASLPYSRDATQPEIYYLETFLNLGRTGLTNLGRDATITRIDFSSGLELNLYQLKVPGGRGIIKARQGWAGQYFYVLTDTADRGVMLDRFDMLSYGDTVALGPFNDQGPGLENPVSFDLASGGHQVYVLYDSGKMVAHNLFDDGGPEGLVADFGAGAADLHVMPDNRVFAGTRDGLFLFSPGGAPELVTDPGALTLVRVRDLSVADVFMVTDDQKAFRDILALKRDYFYLQSPEPVTDIVPVDYSWVKNTRPLIQPSVSSPPYFTLAPNPYFLFFTDPEGDSATVTAVMESDTVSGAYFAGTLNNDTVITFGDVPPGNGLNASFYGGDTPGRLTIRIEAVSADGQVSRREERITIEDLLPPLP